MISPRSRAERRRRTCPRRESGPPDTSLFIARETGRPISEALLRDELAVSVITVGELRAGVVAASDAATRHLRLATLTAALGLGAVPIDDSVADRWALLRVALRDDGQRMPINDSWIAATAMALDVPIITQDADFPVLDVLDVIHV